MNLPDKLQDPLKRRTWWLELEPQWQTAFQTTFLGHNDPPTDDELQQIGVLKTLRLVGPTAPYPNMSFELTNLSGVKDLTNLETLIATHHQLQNLDELANLAQLIRLFVFDNHICHLEGIENLVLLVQLYAQSNQISDLKSLKKLINLQEVYISSNPLKSLEGLTKHHSKKLKNFICLPSDELPQKEIIRVENKLGIQCR